MTDKQQRFLNELIHYIEREKRPPTTRDLQEIMQFKSPRSVGQCLDSLERDGFISRTSGSRNIKILRRPEDIENRKTVRIPVVGKVACGAPLLAEENIEDHIDVSEKIARKPYHYFILKAKGDSMDKAGIKNGDMVLVRQQPAAQDGEVVVALIDDGATIKQLRILKDHVKLESHSSNANHKPIILERDFQIQGVVMKTL